MIRVTIFAQIACLKMLLTLRNDFILREKCIAYRMTSIYTTYLESGDVAGSLAAFAE